MSRSPSVLGQCCSHKLITKRSFHYGFPDLERFESVAFCPSSRHCPAVSAIFAGRGRKGVSGGPAILITIKSLVPVTHIGAFIGRRLSKGACAASPAPGTPQHQSFYHLRHHHHDNDHDHQHHKAKAALRAARPSRRDRGSRIQSGGYILGCSQHCLNVVKVLEGSFWEGTSYKRFG